MERKQEILFNISCRTKAAEYRLALLREALIELDRERLIARVYD